MATFDSQAAVGKALRALREEHGQSQQEIAKALNRTPASVSQIENGHRPPDVKDIYALASLYKRSPGELLPDPLNAAEEAKQAISGGKDGKEKS